MSPGTVIKKYGKYLTNYEMGEILSEQEIY